jgi:hypothetical protein
MALTKLEVTIKSVGEPVVYQDEHGKDRPAQVAVKFDYREQGTFYLPADDPRIPAFQEQLGKTKLVDVNLSKSGKIYLAD